MKHICILPFLFISIGNAAAQQVTFQKTFGGTNWDVANSVQQTTDGGYIITGETWNSTVGSSDINLIKFDANGNSLWTKSYAGIDDDWSYAVRQTMDGGYIIAGYTYSLGTGFADVYLIKTDTIGDTLWIKSFGGAGADRGYSVQQTLDSGYIITGYTNSFGVGDADVYLIKIDANGNSLWAKTFGGTYNDEGKFVQQTADSGYIVVGATRSFGAVNYNVYLIKTDANGNVLWTKAFGGTDDDWGYRVQQTTDGGYIVAGYTNSFGSGDYDIYLVKTDINGDSSWTKTFGGTDIEYGNSVQQTTDGGYIVTGSTLSFGAGNYDLYLIKIDANGDSLWTKTFGGTGLDGGYTVQQTADSGFIIAGSTISFGSGHSDVYLIKTDSLGNSGCYQGSTATIGTTPATQVTTPATIVSSPPTFVTTPATIVGSGGTVTTLCTTVGFVDSPLERGKGCVLSPNPATNNFTITFPSIIHTATVSIYNIMGETIFKENITNTSRKEITLTGINAGIYVVRVIADGVQYTNKLVVQ